MWIIYFKNDWNTNFQSVINNEITQKIQDFLNWNWTIHPRVSKNETISKSTNSSLSWVGVPLSSGDISPNEAADRFSSTLTDYFGEHTEFVKEQKSNSYIAHKPKTLAEARKRKNVLRKKAFSKHATPEDKQLFRQAVRTVSFLNKQGKKKTELKTTAYHKSNTELISGVTPKRSFKTLTGSRAPVQLFLRRVLTYTILRNILPNMIWTRPSLTGFLMCMFLMNTMYLTTCPL